MKESFQFFLWNLNNIEFPWSGSRFKSSIPRIIRFFSIRGTNLVLGRDPFSQFSPVAGRRQGHAGRMGLGVFVFPFVFRITNISG